MGLLGTTTAEQYYNSSQKFTATASQTVFELTVSNPPSSIDDFISNSGTGTREHQWDDSLGEQCHEIYS